MRPVIEGSRPRRRSLRRRVEPPSASIAARVASAFGSSLHQRDTRVCRASPRSPVRRSFPVRVDDLGFHLLEQDAHGLGSLPDRAVRGVIVMTGRCLCHAVRMVISGEVHVFHHAPHQRSDRSAAAITPVRSDRQVVLRKSGLSSSAMNIVGTRRAPCSGSRMHPVPATRFGSNASTTHRQAAVVKHPSRR